jgi:hypothetical protein
MASSKEGVICVLFYASMHIVNANFHNVIASLRFACLLGTSNSTVSAVAGYGLDDKGSDSSKCRGIFPRHRTQSGSGAHPLSFEGGAVGFSPEDKAIGTWTSSYVVSRLRMRMVLPPRVHASMKWRNKMVASCRFSVWKI